MVMPSSSVDQYVYDKTKDYTYNELIKMPVKQLEDIRENKENESLVAETVHAILKLQDAANRDISNAKGYKKTGYTILVLLILIGLGVGGYFFFLQ